MERRRVWCVGSRVSSIQWAAECLQVLQDLRAAPRRARVLLGPLGQAVGGAPQCELAAEPSGAVASDDAAPL